MERWPPGRWTAPLLRASAPSRCRTRCLEVESADILLGEGIWRAEQDLRAVDDLEFAQLARLHGSGARLQVAVGDRAQHLHRGIAEIDRVPQHHRLDAILVDIGLHRV